MSLKSFHLFFILISVVLAFGFGAWCFRNDSSGAAVVLCLAGVGLVIYLGWFLKKMKGAGFLLVASCLFSSKAMACAVCVGNPSAPLTKAANQGIVFLLGVVVFVLAAFAGLFIYWMVRAHRMEKIGLESGEKEPSSVPTF